MKITILILSALNGFYMLADGIYVMLKGKFMGPEKPGPWSVILNKLNIDILKSGPLFITFGIVWLMFLIAFLTMKPWGYMIGIIISVCTLWYLPIGTITSLVIFILLVISRK